MEPTPAKARRYNPDQTARTLRLEGAELGSFPRRAAAFLLDLLRAAILFFPAAMLLGKLIGEFLRHDMRIELNFFHNWYSVVYVVLFYGLSLYWVNGRTIGKRLVGIQVVSLIHHDIRLWQAVERGLGYGASALEGRFGFLQYFIHPNRCTVHDRIAETIVIRDVQQTLGASAHAQHTQQVVDSRRIQA